MMYRKILKHITKGVNQHEVDFTRLSKLQEKINDNEYFSFISEVTNGGFFYNKALHIYGACSSLLYHDVIHVNQTIQKEYNTLAEGLLFFGQDVLGNQFGFSEKGIVFYNVETAEKELIAEDFADWISVILKDLDYFTGRTLLQQWKGGIELDERLCPKIPFVIGGEYKVKNLYSQKYPLYLSSNANIAHQVYNLPEGAEIKLKVIE